MDARVKTIGESALSRVEKKIAAAVACAPPLPDDLTALLGNLIRTAPSTQEGGKS